MKVKTLLNGCLGLLMVAILTGCMSNKITSAKPTSFDAVAEKLNPGGDFYMYYNPVQVLSGLDEGIKQLQEIVISLPDISSEDKTNIDKGFKLASSIVKNSGVTEISGLGLSSIAINDRLYRNTIFIHHYAENNKGILWKLFNQPKAQRLLKLLPADTALAGATDFKTKRLLDWLEAEFNQVNFPQVKGKIAEARAQALKNGVDIDKLLSSFNGQYGIIITLDPEKKSKIPVQGNMLDVPRPGLALVAEVGDDYIFELLKAKLPMAKFTLLKGGTKQLFIQLPKMIDVDLSPTVILTTDGLLIIASNLELANDIIETDKNGKGLLQTEKFKQLAQGIPLQGNGFEFISPKFSEIVADIQKQIINKALDKDKTAKLGKMVLNKFNLLGSVMETFGVTRNTPTGLIEVNNSTASQGTVLLLQATIAPTAIMAGMLLPALNAAREKARRISCASNLKQIGLGLMMYASDHNNNFPPATEDVWLKGLNKYLPADSTVYCCPSCNVIPVQKGQPFTQANTSYIYLGSKKISDILRPSYTPIVMDKPGNHKKYVNVLFADGHVTGFAEFKGQFKSCADVINMLNKKYHYKPAELKDLLSRAVKYDRQ